MSDLDGLGDRLRRLRKTRGMTLRDVQAATGISISHLSAVEHDGKTIGLERALRLAAAYGVGLGTILDGAEPGAMPPTDVERWLLCPHCERKVARIAEATA